MRLKSLVVWNPLKGQKKKTLFNLLPIFGITPAVGTTKSHILVLIEDHCVKNNIMNEVEEKPIVETVEVLKLKLEIEHKELRLEAQRAREEAEAEAQRVCDAAEAEAQRAHEEAQKAEKAARKEARQLRLAELKLANCMN